MQKSHLDQTALQGFNQLVSARRSVRSFEPGEPIPKETLERIADAGRWAPSGANSHPWEICIVEESGRVRDVASLMASQAKPIDSTNTAKDFHTFTKSTGCMIRLRSWWCSLTPAGLTRFPLRSNLTLMPLNTKKTVRTFCLSPWEQRSKTSS